MKIKTITIESGGRASSELKKLLQKRSGRIIHTEEVVLERKTRINLLPPKKEEEIEKGVKIWYYDY